MLVEAVDGLGRLGGEISDERRKWVKKNVGVENDSAARVDRIVALRKATREVVNVACEAVKTNDVLVKVMGGGCKGASREINRHPLGR
jgi:ribosomal protein S9